MPSSVETDTVVLKKLSYVDNVFLLFSYHHPLERVSVLYLNKPESTHPRMIFTMFALNRPNGSGEEIF